MPAQTIDDVIDQLDGIIHWAKKSNSRLGYFPALYRKVTIEVRQRIADGCFDDGLRMERLDVQFANRYLDAFEAYVAGDRLSASWQVALDASHDWSAIVLQHLLLGINAHINLDLGIAAAQTCPGDSIESLHDDFNRINQVLSSLVKNVELALSEVWPMLKLLDWIAGKNEQAIIHFSIDAARKAAWNEALALAHSDCRTAEEQIRLIDKKVALLARSIQHPGPIVGTLTNTIRLGERKGIREIIEVLEAI